VVYFSGLGLSKHLGIKNLPDGLFAVLHGEFLDCVAGVHGGRMHFLPGTELCESERRSWMSGASDEIKSHFQRGL